MDVSSIQPLFGVFKSKIIPLGSWHSITLSTPIDGVESEVAQVIIAARQKQLRILTSLWII
jgi:hypothetical protein